MARRQERIVKGKPEVTHVDWPRCAWVPALMHIDVGQKAKLVSAAVETLPATVTLLRSQMTPSMGPCSHGQADIFSQ